MIKRREFVVGHVISVVLFKMTSVYGHGTNGSNTFGKKEEKEGGVGGGVEEGRQKIALSARAWNNPTPPRFLGPSPPPPSDQTFDQMHL